MAKIKVDLSNEEKVKSVVSFIMLKQLIQPIPNHDAFKSGIVDKNGKMIKEPETPEEEKSYTLFDKLIFKIKRLLGSRLAQLNRFVWLQSIVDDQFFKNLIVTGGLDKRGAVMRVKQDIDKLLEKHGLEHDEFYNGMVLEMLHEQKMIQEANLEKYNI